MKRIFTHFLFAIAISFSFSLISNVSRGQSPQTITTTGTWTCPANVYSVQVECWGGGGAGGSAVGTTTNSRRAAAGGGAGGAYAKANSIAVVPGNTYTVTIGAGGISSTTNGIATAGGDTWFSTSSTVIAKGGAGANSLVCTTSSDLTSAGGIGTTTGSIGDVVYKGGDGASGTSPSSSGYSGGGGSSAGTGSNGNSATNAAAAAAVTGGGIGGSGKSSGNNGSAPASGNGGGGGGAFAAASTTQRTGGSGAAGKIILTYTAVTCFAPTTQTSIGSVSANTTQMTIPVSGGNGDRRLIRLNTSAITLSPVDGTTYSASTAYATAGTEQTILAANATTVTATGLASNTIYHYQAWEYNDCSGSPKYNTTSAPTGNYKTAPLPSSPSVSVITHNSAVLGATFSNNGSSALTDRGTVFNTTSSTVLSSENPLSEGGTSVSAFSHTRSGLSPQTLYYFAGYATNSSGTGVSTSSSFRTLSNPPTTHVSGLSASASSSTQIDVAITGDATFPATDATKYGYLIVYSTGTPALVASPNGLAPAAAVSVGNYTTVITTNPALPTMPASLTGLTASSTYNILLVPFTYDGTNATTYNYLVASAPTTSANTPAGLPAVATTSTITNVSENAASSGGSTLTDAGNAITAKGVVWDIAANTPVLPGLGSTNDGTGTANFTSAISGLSAQTQYAVKAYATNGNGTGYGTTQTFYSLSNPATSHVGSPAASAISYSQIDLSWTGASFPGSGATVKGYIILRASGANSPSLASTNGTAPSAGANTTIVTSTLASTATNYSDNGLSQTITYNYIIVPFTWDGSNTSTYNYYSPITATVISATTPAIPSPSISGFSPSSQYVGGVVVISGSNFASVSDVQLNGVSISSLKYTVTNSTTITINSVPDGNGTFTVVTLGGSATSTNSYSSNGYITSQNGKWSSALSWQGGVIPQTTSTVTIAHLDTIAATTQSAAAININSGGLLRLDNSSSVLNVNGSISNNGTIETVSGSNLNIANGASFSNNGTVTLSGGTIKFSGSATINGSNPTAFYNVDVNGAVDFGNNSSVVGTITFNTSGSVNTNAPTYASGSTLVYNQTGPAITAGIEWTSNATSGAGVPSNVTISSGKTLTLNAANYRQLNGNLTTTGALTLGGSNDLKILGNWSGAGTFTHGSRKIFFNGSSQTLSSIYTMYDVEVNSSSTTGLTINGATTVTNNLLINSGSTVTVNSATLTLSSSSANPSLVYGILINTGSTGTTTISNNLGLTIQNGGIWIHNGNGTISTPLDRTTFASGSTFIFKNTITSAAGTPTISGKTFHHLRFENAAASMWSPAPAGTSNCTVNGDFYIGSLVTIGGTYNATFNVAGNVTIDGVPSSSNTKINMTGINKVFGGAGTLNLSTFSIASSAVVSLNNNVSVGTSFTNNGTFYMGNFNISGAGSFTHGASATLGIGSADGITSSGTTLGNIRTSSATRTLPTTANYVYNGTVAQTTGSGLPTSVNNFEINNAAGISTLSNDLTVNNQLTLTNGTISLGIKNITMGTTATISGGSATSYLQTISTGNLTIPNMNTSAGAKTFPVGTATAYTPVILNNTGTTSNFSVRVKTPITNIVYDSTEVVALEWPIAASVSSGTNVSATFQWNAANQATGFSPTNNCEMGRWAGSAYLITHTGLSTSGSGPYTLTATGLNSFTAPNNIYVIGEVANVSQPVFVPTLSTFAPSSGFGGSIITLTGSDFFGVAQVTIGGQPVNIVYNNKVDTMKILAGGISGQIVVTNSAGSANSSALSPNIFTSNGYVTDAAGDWNTGATWLNGTIPQVASNVTINHPITINNTVTDVIGNITINNLNAIVTGASGAITVGSLTNNGLLDMTSGGVITISNNQSFTNNNTFISGAGKVIFTGAGNASASTIFNNIDINGPVDLGNNSTVNGTLTMKTGGSIAIHSPLYGTSSTLSYASSGSTFTPGLEWISNTAAGAGVPNNVSISSNTTLDFGSTNQYYQIAKDITVATGSVLVLATQSGGDLKIKGNWNCNGTFTPNNRVVYFNGNKSHYLNTTNTFSNVYISGNDTLNIAASSVIFNGAIGDAIYVGNGAVLNINSGKSASLALGATATFDGTLINNSSFTNSNTVAGKLIFGATSYYKHNTGVNLPFYCTFSTGSTVEFVITSATSYTTSGGSAWGFNNNFHHVIFNSPSQTVNFQINGSILNVGGNLTFVSTGASGSIRYNATTATNLNVTGNLVLQNNSKFVFTSGSASPKIKINGDVDLQNTSTIETNTGAGQPWIELKGNLSIASGAKIISSGNGLATFNFVKLTGTQTFSAPSTGIGTNQIDWYVGNDTTTNKLQLLADFIVGDLSSIAVWKHATLSCGPFNVKQSSGTSATFDLADTATLEIGSATGISANGSTGNIQIPTPTYSNKAHYVYNGATAQLTGNGLPTTVLSLNINNSGNNGNNTVTLQGNITTPQLKLSNGLFATGSNTIDISNNGIVTATAGNFESTSSSGTFNFVGAATVSGTIDFYRTVTIGGAVDFGTSSTIQNTLQINQFGSVVANAPSFATNSTLKYNKGNSFGRGIEWNNTTGAGYPFNVHLTGNTTLNLSNGSPSINRKCAGKITIDAGSKLNLNTPSDEMTGTLEAVGGIDLQGVLELSSLVGNNFSTAGDFIRTATATFIQNNNTVKFTGSSTQKISVVGGGNQIFEKFELNNSTTNVGSGVLLDTGVNATNLYIKNILTLTLGKINTFNNEVFVQDSLPTSIAGYDTLHASSSSSFIIGNLRRRVGVTPNLLYDFPLGTDANKYEIARIKINNNSNVDNILANFTNFGVGCIHADIQPFIYVQPTNAGAGATVVNKVLNYGYYTIEPYDNNNVVINNPSINYNVSMTFNGHNNAVVGATVPQCYTIVKRAGHCSSNAWTLGGGSFDNTTQKGSSGTTSTITATLNGLTGFSDFGMGFNGGGNVLPIELSQFLVQLRSNDAILSWTTLSERNSEKFEIERSLDGIIFEKIAEQQAAGNSNFEINYQAIDYNVANNNSKIIYYRLKQTDFDGSFIYSPIKTIILKNLVNSFNIHGVYPNPFTNNINIKFEAKETDEIRYELFDSKGGLIVHQRVIPEKGINTTTISLLNELSKGMYLLKITDGNVSYTTILQKQ